MHLALSGWEDSGGHDPHDSCNRQYEGLARELAKAKELIARQAVEIERLRRQSNRYNWLIDGKRSKYIWNHVLTDEEKEGHSFLADVIDAAITKGLT